MYEQIGSTRNIPNEPKCPLHVMIAISALDLFFWVAWRGRKMIRTAWKFWQHPKTDLQTSYTRVFVSKEAPCNYTGTRSACDSRSMVNTHIKFQLVRCGQQNKAWVWGVLLLIVGKSFSKQAGHTIFNILMEAARLVYTSSRVSISKTEGSKNMLSWTIPLARVATVCPPRQHCDWLFQWPLLTTLQCPV